MACSRQYVVLSSFKETQEGSVIQLLVGTGAPNSDWSGEGNVEAGSGVRHRARLSGQSHSVFGSAVWRDLHYDRGTGCNL